jgi:hypothetical protein
VLTAGGTVGLDALARRRSRRRTEGEKSGSPALDPPQSGTTNDKEDSAAPRAPSVRAEHHDPTGESKTRVITVSPPGKPAERPTSPIWAGPSESMERTAIVVKRGASAAKQPSAPKPKRPPESSTYRSANAKSEANGDDHDAVPAATNGDSAAVPSDVRVVLQPKRLGGENGGKSQ